MSFHTAWPSRTLAIPFCCDAQLSAPEPRSPVVALSLGGLRRKIEALMMPDEVRVVLQLDGLAERERHRRQA